MNKVRFRGLTLLYKKCLGAVGLLIGAVLFCLLVFAAQTRVLKIEVVGSGAYYKSQILSVLEENGVKRFSQKPENTALLSARILSLPRVSYCSLKCEGGILTVDVRVSEEYTALSIEPLLAPVSGRIEELIVVRGTARVAVGDTVEQGQTVVDGIAFYGEQERAVIVIARVRMSFSVSEEFGGSEEQAKLSAYLKYGEMQDLHTEKTDGGFLVSGTAFAEAAMNLN